MVHARWMPRTRATRVRRLLRRRERPRKPRRAHCPHRSLHRSAHCNTDVAGIGPQIDSVAWQREHAGGNQCNRPSPARSVQVIVARQQSDRATYDHYCCRISLSERQARRLERGYLARGMSLRGCTHRRHGFRHATKHPWSH